MVRFDQRPREVPLRLAELEAILLEEDEGRSASTELLSLSHERLDALGERLDVGAVGTPPQGRLTIGPQCRFVHLGPGIGVARRAAHHRSG